MENRNPERSFLIVITRFKRTNTEVFLIAVQTLLTWNLLKQQYDNMWIDRLRLTTRSVSVL